VENSKRIAVFIPCYNASLTLAETLRSVEHAVAELDFPVPVYLYDDCSKDESIAIARNTWKDPGTLIIKQNGANQGERRTTNEAFQYFSGRYDWVFIIHADDIAKAGWLKELCRQIGQVDNEEYFTVWSSFDSLDHISGNTMSGDNTGNISKRERTKEEKINYITKLYCNWHLSGAAINVSLFHRLNGFDESMAQFGDTDFFARGLLAGFRDLYLSRTLTFYRIVSNSVSSTSVRTNRDIKEVNYIISKFKDRLNKGELRKLYRKLSFLAFRRSCRSIVKADIPNFSFSFGVIMRTFAKQVRSYLK
jgi:glycosyltransferase involved in cell wall biosynthesis